LGPTHSSWLISERKVFGLSAFYSAVPENFGVPYTVQDIATNPIGTNVNLAALIIIGHSQLDTNQVYLGQRESGAAFRGSLQRSWFD